MDVYKHFIRIDTNNIVIDGYADWQVDRRGAEEIQLTGEFGRHFQKELMTERGQFIYKLENGAMVQRSQADLDDEWAGRPKALPTTEERLASTESALLDLMLGGL